MTDFEKVTQGLLHHIKPIPCDGCPYDDEDPHCSQRLAEDAFALLKEQEARVMTLEKIEDCDSVMWIEFKSSIYPAIYHDRHGKWLFITRKSQYWLGAEKHYADDYNKTWRCWTSHPTDDLRKAVKWDG